MSLQSESLTSLRKQAVNTSALNRLGSLASLEQAATQWGRHAGIYALFCSQMNVDINVALR